MNISGQLYKHIFVTTNLTKDCQKVIEHAATLAKLTKAKISIGYVLPHNPDAYCGEFSIEIDHGAEVKFETKVRKALSKICEKYGIPLKNQIISDGSVVSTILNLSEKIDADLIVIGAHHHDYWHALFGSKAGSISNQSRHNVLVIHTE